MDVAKAVSAYIQRMITEVAGIKVLLLDQDTTPIISTSFTQSSLLSHEVYLTDRVDNANRDRMRHLNCIALVRPTPQSISALTSELRQPKYKSYWLYFTNVLQKQDIELLAEADEHEVVKEIQEFFADYLPVNSDLFSLNIDTPPSRIWADTPAAWDQQGLDQHVKGLLALLLSLKKRPVIRYERMSALAKKLGEELSAMVHEVLGIRNGRVSLADADGVRPDLQEIVLSGDQDPFFSANLYDNFGDLGASIKKYVLEYQSRTASNATIDTVADMKRFVEEYPEFRKLGGNVSKHVALLGELSRRVEKDSLLEISELEQSLASVESHASDLKAVQSKIESPKITHDAKIRVAILYALRYQKLPSNQIQKVVQDLLKAGVPESRAALVFVTLNIAGADQRQDDLFANENFFSRGRSALKGLKGVENVYTQHTPHLVQTVDNLMRGRLRDTSYPFVSSSQSGAPSNLAERPQDVILFIIGGATYEEARSIALLNAQHQRGAQAGAQQSAVGGMAGTGTRFLLGGTSVHNSRTYLDMIQDAASRFDGRFAKPPANLGSGGPALNLSIGPVQLAVGGGAGGSRQDGSVTGAAAHLLDPEYLGEAASGAKNLATDIFSRVRRGVEGTISGLQ
ncbi:hypothetical protein NDA16_004399 [Ustilago loliicola]|nr:hypothetical protein NDA16_004399 [Ustilago loliicola]